MFKNPVEQRKQKTTYRMGKIFGSYQSGKGLISREPFT
jgi:hypothetical protein